MADSGLLEFKMAIAMIGVVMEEASSEERIVILEAFHDIVDKYCVKCGNKIGECSCE